MSSNNRAKFVFVACIWLAFLGLGVGIYVWVFKPMSEKKAEEAAEQKEKDTIAATSSDSIYKQEVTLWADGFSGYSVWRSPEFANSMRKEGIKWTVYDDFANYKGSESPYVARLRALDTGECQMAVFTWGSLIKASDALGEMPAVGVAITDETRGADSAMAYKDVVPTVDALNHPDTEFRLTMDSPSETLIRVMQSRFQFDRLGSDPFKGFVGAEEVYKDYRKSKPNERVVWVVWEPFASKMEENPNIHRLIDSSRFRGYIVDVLVVSRDFLLKQPDTVRMVVENYFRIRYDYRDRMVELVLADAQKTGLVISEKQAETLVDGIWFKNVTENYAHFGLQSGGNLQHAEDMIRNLTKTFLDTGVIKKDPTNGQPNLLYYDKIMQQMHTANFHPGIQPESVRDDSIVLPRLSDTEWEGLRPLGTLQVPKLSFSRGTSRLHERSHAVLDDLLKTIDTLPTSYVLVYGDAATIGDIDANKVLAQQRAEAAKAYLIANGVAEHRVKATSGMPSGTPSVRFVVGESPY